MCGFVQVACQGFLVREACVGVLVSGAVFLLSPFEDLGCFFGCLMSSAGIQKLFCGILFIVVFPHCVWVCTGGLSSFPG